MMGVFMRDEGRMETEDILVERQNFRIGSGYSRFVL